MQRKLITTTYKVGFKLLIKILLSLPNNSLIGDQRAVDSGRDGRQPIKYSLFHKCLKNIDSMAEKQTIFIDCK